MTANPHRGEVAVTLAGTTYVLRPTFAAIAAIETATGAGVYALAERLHAMLRSEPGPGIGAKDVAAILAAGMAGADRPTSGEEAGRIAVAAGLVPAAAAAFAFLVAALTGPDEAR
jgi:hypothetical protein